MLIGVIQTGLTVFMCISVSVINANHGPVAQEFSKKGCPISLRAMLWLQMLGVEIDDVVSQISHNLV